MWPLCCCRTRRSASITHSSTTRFPGGQTSGFRKRQTQSEHLSKTSNADLHEDASALNPQKMECSVRSFGARPASFFFPVHASKSARSGKRGKTLPGLALDGPKSRASPQRICLVLTSLSRKYHSVALCLHLVFKNLLPVCFQYALKNGVASSGLPQLVQILDIRPPQSGSHPV